MRDNLELFSIFDLEIIQQFLVIILRGEAGICEIAVHMAPFFEAPVIEEFEFLSNNERHDAVCKALLEHHQTTHTTIPVLEGMDGLEFLMKVDDDLQILFLYGVIACKKRLHTCVYLFRRAGGIAAHFVRKFLVVSHIEPRLAAVGSSCLQDPVNLFDEGFGKFLLCPVDDKVDASEVIGGFYDIIHIDALVRDADGVCLEDVPRLLMGKPAAFDVIGVVGKVDLGAVINASAHLALFLLPEPLKKRSRFHLALLGKRGVHGNIPRLSYKEGSFHLSGSTPVANGALGKIMLLCIPGNSDEVHMLSANIVLNQIQI